VGNDSFDVTVVERLGRTVVVVRGEVDMVSGSRFRDALCTAQQSSADVVVDMSDVTFLDSTGINALVGAHGQTPPDGSFGVVGAQAAVRKVFDITGIAGVLMLEPEGLTWHQVTYHTGGWRQWMTEETTQDGKPIAEIIEVGSHGNGLGDKVQYVLESDGVTTPFGSLDEAMRAAELHRSVAPQTSDR
jgi:anti-sigma B factor antagonist